MKHADSNNQLQKYLISINEIKSKIDTLILLINSAHRAKSDEWGQSCWEASNIVLAEINGLLDDVQQKHDLAAEYRIELDKLSQRNCELRMENAALKEQSVTEQVAWRTFEEWFSRFSSTSTGSTKMVPEMEWQPIETAPKDGTHIIAAYAKRNVFSSRRIWADIVKWDSTYNGWVDDQTEHFMSDKLYSHWMPLLPIDK